MAYPSLEVMEQRIEAAISNAYYEARDSGETMTTAAKMATGAVSLLLNPLYDALAESINPAALARALHDSYHPTLSWPEPRSYWRDACEEMADLVLAKYDRYLSVPE